MTSKSKQNLDSQTAEQARDFARQKISEVQGAQENIMSAISQAQEAVLNTSGLKDQSGMVDLNKKALDFTKSNIASSFDLATKLVDITDVSEAMELQNQFVKNQLEAYTKQAKELTQMAAKPLKK